MQRFDKSEYTEKTQKKGSYYGAFIAVSIVAVVAILAVVALSITIVVTTLRHIEDDSHYDRHAIIKCLHSPCLNGGSCRNTDDSYICDCAGTGYDGDLCQTDIDECESNNSCMNNEVCENTDGSYECNVVTAYGVDTLGRDCSDVWKIVGARGSGVYQIHPEGAPTPFDVYCKMDEVGAWTIIQRRYDGSISFYRNWEEYKKGFGQINTEYWIGNDNIYFMTNDGSYKLRIDMEKFEGQTAYTEYDPFWIDDEANNYTLHLGDSSGTAGDSLDQVHTTRWRNNENQFSTFDRDNDNDNYNCATDKFGGWWFNDCTQANLNGYYFTSDPDSSYSSAAITWQTWNIQYPLKSVTMSIHKTG